MKEKTNLPDVRTVYDVMGACATDWCEGCPGYAGGDDGCKYWDEMFESLPKNIIEDALLLLNEQIPRVLQLDEIKPQMTFWLEDIDKDEVIPAIGGSSAGGCKCFIDVYDRSIAAKDDEYNVRWRAWTLCPTEDIRNAEPWETK